MSLLRAEQSVKSLDKQCQLLKYRLWARKLFLAHLVYVPDGSKLQKIEKIILPQPSSPHLSFPPPSAPFLLCMCIYPYPLTNTHRFPPSDLLSRHLCSCLSPAGCSIALNLGIFQKCLCICLQVQNCPRHQQKATRKMQMGHRCYYTDRA